MRVRITDIYVIVDVAIDADVASIIAHVFFSFSCNYIQGVPKKRTFGILLEQQCSGSITSSRHPLCLEINFFVVSY